MISTLVSALVDPSWLMTRLDDPDLRVLDASFALPGTERDVLAAYRGGHIPGARFFDIEAIAAPDTPLPHMLPSPEQFSAQVGALGIGNAHKIVVYDSDGMVGAARAWWMFRAMGHAAVTVLDGGLVAWRESGGMVTKDVSSVTLESFSATARSGLVVNVAQICENMHREAIVPLDARPASRFMGMAGEPRPGLRRGHIPGALNVPWHDVLNPARKSLLPAEVLVRRFAAAGLAPDDAVFVTCGSGVSACMLALALHEIGRGDVPVYDGSWAEWGARPGLPVARLCPTPGTRP